MRLGFSYLDPAELDEAARRMARALIRTRSSPLPKIPAAATNATTPSPGIEPSHHRPRNGRH
jgi:hypothetical protein